MHVLWCLVYSSEYAFYIFTTTLARIHLIFCTFHFHTLMIEKNSIYSLLLDFIKNELQPQAARTAMYVVCMSVNSI